MILINSTEQRLLMCAVCIGMLSLASIGSLIGCGFAFLDTTPPTLVTISNVTAASESISFELVNPNGEAIRVRITLESTPEPPAEARVVVDDASKSVAETIIRLTGRDTDGASKNIQITGLTNGVEYTITFTIADSSGNLQRATATATATPLAPPEPPALTVAPGDSSVTLTWVAPTTGVTVDGYRIWRAVRGDEEPGEDDFRLLVTDPKTLGKDIREYIDTSVADDTDYKYYIRAVNANGTESVDSNTGPSPFHLHANGVTILCPFAADGATGMINGDLYTKRTAMEIENLAKGDDAAMENAARSCTSGITSMSFLFEGEDDFNEDISHWDTSSVIHMSNMFQDAIAFDRDIGHWNVAAVQYMRHMFNGAGIFNQDIGDWKVDAVTDMGFMFNDAGMFDQDISRWKVGAVMDMSSMFKDAVMFNRDLRGWSVANVCNNTDFGSGVTIANPPRWSSPLKPCPPRRLRATAGDGQVMLTWTTPDGNAPSQYAVYRSSGGGAATRIASGSVIAIATHVDTNGVMTITISYTDTGLTNGTAYTYTVRALNASDVESDDSFDVVVTPTASTGG